MNSWWEIKIVCDPGLEESIYWRLENFGCRGTATQIKGTSGLSCFINAYMLEIEAEVLDLAALSLWLCQDAVLLGFPPPETRWDLIDEQDWGTSWKEHWQPQEIGDRFLIYPAWLDVPTNPERIILRLDPGMAFGTGAHATTQLCLEGLEMRMDSPNNKEVVVDIGCGSGILALGAILLGAEKVYAVDTDPLAVSATEHNRKLNGISAEKILVNEGSVEALPHIVTEGVDGIVCNILADIIIDLIPDLTMMVKPNSWGVFTGILIEQMDSVIDKLEQEGWDITTIWKQDEWCCLNVKRY